MTAPTALLVSLLAQSGAPAAGPADLAQYLRRAFDAVSANTIAAAELMPADAYGFRPAGAPEVVRTFAQLVGHTLEVNAFVCAASRGKADPLAGTDGDAIADKARLVRLLEESVRYCREQLADLDDAALLRPMVTTAADGTRRSTTPANVFVFAIAHASEHYGNIVTYLRSKGLTPPPTPPQAGWRTPVR